MVSTQIVSPHCPKANATEKSSDQVEDPDIGHESLSDLQIPTLSVSGTPASWISRSKLVTSKMASQYDGDSSCDEAASSLGDSAYDFLDDRSATTDDEERDLMADSTSSESLEPLRLSSPSAAWSHASQDSHLDDSPVSLKTPTTHGMGFGNSRATLNIRENEPLAEDPEEPIQFEEPSVVNLNSSRLTEVYYTLRTIRNPFQAESELQNAIKALPDSRCHITVRQTMTSQSIDLKGKPYKVFVVGQDPAIELVIKKIASALATSTNHPKEGYDDASPGKFSIVPVSAFGDSGNPDVVLIDSGLELCVEYCDKAYYMSTKDCKDTLHLRMVDRESVQSSWIQSEGQYSLSRNWTLPDLAILFTSGEEKHPLADMTRGVAHSFMHRYGVPSIVIEKNATWVKSTTLDYLTPHLCLETQQAHGHNDSAKVRFPIDLPTFLNIDAGQLNRNLACLARPRPGTKFQADTSTRVKESQGVVWSPYTVKAFYQTAERLRKKYSPQFLQFLKLNSVLVITLVLLGSLVGCLVGLGSFKATSMGTSMSPIINSSTTQGTAQPLQSSAFTPVVSSIPSTSSQKSPTKSLSSNTEIASFLLDAYALGPDRSDDFLVQILGDHHIVVNTPRWIHQSKKAPALLFEISRQNRSLEYASSKIGEGVYALQIPYEEANGVLNMSITIQSKIIKQKHFEVDFGSSWLQRVEWKRLSQFVADAVQQDLSIVQTSLSAVYNHSLTGLSTFVHQTRHTLAAKRRVKRAILASHLKWRLQTKAILLAQSKELSKYVSRVRAGHKKLAQQVPFLRKDFAKSISTYTNHRAQAISRHADVYRQKLQEGKEERQAVAAEYLKIAQKKALRAWWKIVGVPKRSPLHRSPSDGKPPQNIPEKDENVHSCF